MGDGMTNPRGAVNVHAHLDEETETKESDVGKEKREITPEQTQKLKDARAKADNAYRNKKGFLQLVGRAVKGNKSVEWIVGEIKKEGKHISVEGCKNRIRNLRKKLAAPYKMVEKKNGEKVEVKQNTILIPRIDGENETLTRDEELGVLGKFF